MADFTAMANEQSLVRVQLEHEDAIRNVGEILQVEGVDVFFIGPFDLSQSMGHPENANAPAVAKAIEETPTKIVAAGKLSGMPATADNVASLVGAGVRYIYTHLPRVLGTGATAFLKAAKG
jgi:2-keto-3-deoxy-L-rhamnonate aldolase RhmA